MTVLGIIGSILMQDSSRHSRYSTGCNTFYEKILLDYFGFYVLGSCSFA